MKILAYKTQSECLKILKSIAESPPNFFELQKSTGIQKAFLLHLIFILTKLEIISDNFDSNTYTLLVTDPKKWPALLNSPITNSTQKSFLSFDRCSLYFPYECPQLDNITIQELSHKDYFEAKEYYDFEAETLLASINWGHPMYRTNFFARHFSSFITDCTGLKRTHVLIAKQNDSIVGILATSNYASEYVAHRLPCNTHEIYNVNIVATRKEASNHGIATKLVQKASEIVFNQDNAYALCYDPLIPESKSVMMKVFYNNKFFMHRRNYSDEDIMTYGPLYKYIITRNLEYENENTI